jgi:large subunit ribosomal protein L22
MDKLLKELLKKLKDMQFRTTQKFIRTTPRKLREVALLVRKMTPEEAIEKLPHVRKKAAEPILKSLKTAVANAKQGGVNVQDLILKEIQINEGPVYKRWRAGGRGMVKPYQKKTSHIRIVVEKKEEKKPKGKKETKSKVDTKKKSTKTTKKGAKK